MKLKFINLLLAAFLLIGSAQALTSCKDTDEDLYTQLRDDNLTLKKNFEIELAGLNERINDLKTITDGLDAQIKLINGKLDDYVTKDEFNSFKANEFQKLIDQYNSLLALYNTLKTQVEALEALKADVEQLKSDRDGFVQQFINVENHLATLDQTLENYSEIVTNVDNLMNFMESTQETLATIDSSLGDINSSLGDINQTLGSMGIDVESLKTSVNNLNTFMTEWSPKLGTIEQNAADALALAQKNEGDITALTQTYEQLQQLVINNQNATDAQLQVLQDALTSLENKMQTVLDDYTTKGDVDQAIADAISGLATQDALEALAATLRKEAQANLDAVELRLQQQIITNINRLNGLDTKVSDLEDRINELDDAVKTFISNYPGTIDDILQDIQNVSTEFTEQIANLSTEISEQMSGMSGNIEQAATDILENAANIQKNKEAVEALEKKLDAVIVRVYNLENRITSIVLQGTENAVFGYLKTPFGFESNVLMNYMGENVTGMPIEFPNFVIEGEEYDGQLIITDADQAILGTVADATNFNIGATLFNEADGNLGTVYLTLNPSQIKLEGKEFTVVTSSGKEMPIKLKNLRPSTKELTHGYSRTVPTSPNGFYEADVTVANGDVPTLRVVVDQNLKASAKKVLSDLRDRKISGSAIASLGNALYEQFNGFLPALGIRAAWDETVADKDNNKVEQKQSVYSQYGLAAATFNPLSYKFLYGTSIRGIRVPDFSGILDDYKFDFSENGLNIKFNPITIDGVNVNFSLNINPQIDDLNLGTVSTTTSVTIEDFPVGVDDDGNLITETKVIPVDVNIDLNNSDLAANLSSSIESALQNALSGLDGEINSQLQGVIDSLIGQIQGQVNDMMSSLENQVNTSLSDILGNLQNQVNGKIDMIGDKINAVTGRLDAIVKRFNGILANANHYLQPTLLYSMKGESFGMFSTSKAFPSQFTGSGNAVMLVPTTYTGETVTPAFKKFVAVTNVYKSNNYSINAQAGDAKCKQLAEAANALEYMNCVVPGERRTIPFSYEGGKGYTYEIVYQALDYSGFTSTAKYYVSIK